MLGYTCFFTIYINFHIIIHFNKKDQAVKMNQMLIRRLSYSISLSIFMCLVSLKSYGQMNNAIDTSAIREIRIDPRSAFDEENYAEDVFSSVKFIPLETKKECEFGKIDQLEVTKDFFIILDASVSTVNLKVQSAILIYTHEGKFYAKITGEDIHYITVNQSSKEISFVNQKTSYYFTYDFSGKLLRKNKTSSFFVDFIFLDNDINAYYLGYSTYDKALSLSSEKKFHNLVIKDNRNLVTTRYLTFDPRIMSLRDVLGTRKFFYTSDKNTYFIKPLF